MIQRPFILFHLDNEPVSLGMEQEGDGWLVFLTVGAKTTRTSHRTVEEATDAFSNEAVKQLSRITTMPQPVHMGVPDFIMDLTKAEDM